MNYKRIHISRIPNKTKSDSEYAKYEHVSVKKMSGYFFTVQLVPIGSLGTREKRKLMKQNDVTPCYFSASSTRFSTT